jgi:hypothetical protein
MNIVYGNEYLNGMMEISYQDACLYNKGLFLSFQCKAHKPGLM